MKLGIKSSLPHVKSTLALAILLWECSDHPAELIYSEQNGDETVMASQLEQWVIDYLNDICEEEHISPDDLISGFKSLFRIFTKEKKGSKIREKEKR